nr:protein kinase [Deltaproteobacteria bacterium]
MTGDPAEIPLPDSLRAQYRVSFIRFQSPTAALFEGVDPQHGRTVLVKVMRPDPTASPADRQRVRRELQKLVQVRHPVLVPVLDLGEENDLTWIVRPFVVGETLAERIASRGRLSPVEAATLGLHLASGLGELHRHGLLHRDLRPGHVLLGQDGGVYLIDAGLGRTFVSPDGRALVGCPGYAAPEAILGRLMSFRSDLYSLGAVLYEALSGMPPYMALDPRRMMQLQCEADPEPLDPSVPPALTRLVSTLLARDPRERPMSAQIVERQLEPMVPSIPPPPEGDVEMGERTLMSDSVEGLISPAGLVYEQPAQPFREPTPAPVPTFRVPTPAPQPVFREPTPAPVFRAPTPAPAQSFKQTMMGHAPEGPPGAAPTEADGSSLVSIPAEALDFDDVVDTNQNEASRVFGIPVNARVSGGSAIPPLSPSPTPVAASPQAAPEMTPFQAYGPGTGVDPASAPRMSPPPYGEAPAAPMPMAPGSYPQPELQQPPGPQFEPPVSHTVAMDGPPPAAFMNYGQPMQGQPMQGQPMQGQPMPMQGQPMQGQPMQGQPMQGQPMQGQPQWSPYGPGMGAPGPISMQPPAPQAPKSRGAGLLIGLLGLVAIAGGGGYLAARVRRARTPSPTPPALSNPAMPPAQPVVQPTMPEAQPAVPDASALLAEVDVPSALETDVPSMVEVTPDVPTVVATPDAGSVVAVVAPTPAVVDAGTVAPTPTDSDSDSDSDPDSDSAPDARGAYHPAARQRPAHRATRGDRRRRRRHDPAR